MTIDSPILGACAAMLALAVFLLARQGGRPPRWLLRGGALAAAVAVAGVGVRCDRPLEIAVMIDVSPSTRGATFRDDRSVRARLTPLLAGRPYTVHYFADGEQPTATEPAAGRTRLPRPDTADAMILMSDGRFDAPAGLPPTFVVVDPALDAPADARVRSATIDTAGLTADVVGEGPHRQLMLHGRGEIAHPPVGPAIVTVPAAELPTGTAEIGFAPGDAWPENDAMTATPPSRPGRRIAVELTLPGFESVSRSELASSAQDLDVAVIVTPTIRVDDDAAGRVRAGIESRGGTLLLAGPPDATPPTLKQVAPLSAEPPAGPIDWIVLLDGSGSMAVPAASPDGRPDPNAPAAMVPGARRWDRALAAARTAVGRLDDQASSGRGARVTVMRFGGDLRTIVDAAPAHDAVDRLSAAEAYQPTGPTGLRAALEAIADDRTKTGRGVARLLLLTDGEADLGDVSVLATRLRSAGVTLSAVCSGDARAIRAVADQTGGTAATNVDVLDWSTALGGLVGRAFPVVDRREQWAGTGSLAGQAFTSTRRWPAFAVDGAAVVVGGATPVVASRQVGEGRIVSVAADVPPAELARIARTFERPPADPRFRVQFDERAGLARLTAVDAAGPINGLQPMLMDDSALRVPLDPTAPGTYEAPLPRSQSASTVSVGLDRKRIAWHHLAGKYATEFDVVGNDHDAMIALAASTGGALIAPGDNRPLSLAKRQEIHSLRPAATFLSAILLLVGVFEVRRSPLAGRP